MRRIVVLLAVVALLMLALAAPAFAKNSFQGGQEPPGPPSSSFGPPKPDRAGTIVVHCNAPGGSFDNPGVLVNNKNGTPQEAC